MSDRPAYYIMIPANVRYDKNIPDKAKLLYGEIASECDIEGCCCATNVYFAELYGITNKSVSRLISALSNSGYIDVELIYKKDSKEIEKRIISIKRTL